ncbi:hypothetical protein TNIN_316101 [Trichonephila inaurata madagascariensis]|uniref:Uncharacterized protein n=1 Tax=Trichonephila inaurata madagascariensis TaxID=2747483 RepID=A0A8X7CMW3_9ARAC|nr:hypothetical protein TNIN_316101 [Trichonephila inaurata madagascariensis]
MLESFNNLLPSPLFEKFSQEVLLEVRQEWYVSKILDLKKQFEIVNDWMERRISQTVKENIMITMQQTAGHFEPGLSQSISGFSVPLCILKAMETKT